MTIAKLLELPTDELGKLVCDHNELSRILTPYLPVTRPATRRVVTSVKVTGVDTKSALARAMAGELEPEKPKTFIKLK